MKRFCISFFSLLWAAGSCMAQQESSQTARSFQDFRKGILENYQGFRKKVLDDYADYLGGIWKAYEAFRGMPADSTPKPSEMPRKNAEMPELPPVVLSPEVIPSVLEPKPISKPESEPKPKPELPRLPDPVPIVPSSEPKPVSPVIPQCRYAFYDYHFSAPAVSLPVLEGMKPTQLSDYWKRLSRENVLLQTVLPALQSEARSRGLNDWFTFELFRAYVDALFADSDRDSRIALAHFLLNHAGYDVRLGRSDRQLMLLVPFAQMVYARTYLQLDGKKYYVFRDNLNAVEENGNMSFYTCELPKTSYTGNVLDLQVHKSMKLPESDLAVFRLTDGTLVVEGYYDDTVIRMFHHYPQMPIPCYARSILFPDVRQEIVSQLKDQLKDLELQIAVDKLLHFVQYAFPYATDDEQHGFEKPYFFEELLYYPKCDCEDRSVFYAYLLREVLGVENHLIHFPGHECVAVCLGRTLHGDGYMYKGKQFYISDPTYMGASTGMCMPDYRSTNPQVEEW